MKKLYVYPDVYAILRTKHVPKNYFAIINDRNETTVVIEQKYTKDYEKISRNWRIISFDITLPFTLVGFLAKISQALAEENISIFALSAYTTDHILVKNKDLKKAIIVLKKIGFK